MYNMYMLFLTTLRDYLHWHYGPAFHELFQVWLNFLWFIIHFFSLPQLGRSLFSPWKRITEQKQRGFSFENLASVIIIGLLSRLVGFLIRGSVLLVGLIILALVTISGLAIYLLWFAAPLIMVLLVGVGFSLILSQTIL